MLEVEKLVVRYGQITALKGVSLKVGEGELIAIVGPNGAGKSTLLLTIAGALTATAGHLIYQGRSLEGIKPEVRVRQGIALIPERWHIFSSLTVGENLMLGSTTRKDKSAVKDDVERSLERFPILKERFHASAANLSGGERQQLAIARSLLASPRLLLVDEPSLGLAPMIVAEVFKVLTNLREEGVTILLVEQNAKQAIAIADRTYVLANGEIVAHGTGAGLAESTEVDFLGIYLGTAKATPSPPSAQPPDSDKQGL